MAYPAGVIFDFDGTLIDSAPDILRALNQMLLDYRKPPLALEQVKNIIGDGVILLVERALNISGIKSETVSVSEAIDRYHHHYLLVPPNPECVMDGVPSVLAHLRHAGVKLGLCTNKPEAATLRILRTLELRNYFDAVAGGDTMPFRKPDGRHASYVAARMGVAAQNAVFVGDSVNDIVAARSAGMKIVLVPNGYGSGTLPEVDAKITHFRFLPEVLQGLMKAD